MNLYFILLMLLPISVPVLLCSGEWQVAFVAFIVWLYIVSRVTTIRWKNRGGI